MRIQHDERKKNSIFRIPASRCCKLTYLNLIIKSKTKHLDPKKHDAYLASEEINGVPDYNFTIAYLNLWPSLRDSRHPN